MFRKKKSPPPVITRQRSRSLPARDVFSYYASPGNAANPRQGSSSSRASDTKVWWQSWRLLPSAIAIMTMIFSLVYTTTIDTNPRIASLASETPNLLRELGVYQAAGQKLLASSILNHSKLTMNTKEFARQLQSQFPELRVVSVTLPLVNRRPIVEVEPDKAVMIMVMQNEAYIINQDGLVLMRARDAKPAITAQLPSVTDDSGLSTEVGQIVLPKNTIHFVLEVLHQFKEKQLTVSTITLPTVVNEVRFTLQNEHYFVKFNTLSDARVQTGQYLTLREQLLNQRVTPSEYIDVRVEEHTYYQ